VRGAERKTEWQSMQSAVAPARYSRLFSALKHWHEPARMVFPSCRSLSRFTSAADHRLPRLRAIRSYGCRSARPPPSSTPPFSSRPSPPAQRARPCRALMRERRSLRAALMRAAGAAKERERQYGRLRQPVRRYEQRYAAIFCEPVIFAAVQPRRRRVRAQSALLRLPASPVSSPERIAALTPAHSVAARSPPAFIPQAGTMKRGDTREAARCA